MATKIFKRSNGKNVFEKVAEQDDPAATDAPPSDIENTETATELDIDESTESRDHATQDAGVADGAGDAGGTENAGDTDTAGDGTSVPTRRQRWLRHTLTTLAGTIVVAILALSGFLAWQLKQDNDIAAASRAALAAAQSYAVVLTSIDANNVDQNFTQVLDGSTGEFKDVYSQSASQLRQVLIENKAMSRGIVVDSAIKSATKTKVTVLLFVDQSVTNTVNPQPRIDRSRVVITMELVDNRWLASKVDLK
jgi:Mce-associated membrane protein